MIVHVLHPNIIILSYEPSDLKRCVGANNLKHHLPAFQMIDLCYLVLLVGLFYNVLQMQLVHHLDVKSGTAKGVKKMAILGVLFTVS